MCTVTLSLVRRVFIFEITCSSPFVRSPAPVFLGNNRRDIVLNLKIFTILTSQRNFFSFCKNEIILLKMLGVSFYFEAFAMPFLGNM